MYSSGNRSAAYVFIPVDLHQTAIKTLKIKQDYTIGGERPADRISIILTKS
jgi:hypothetical protein